MSSFSSKHNVSAWFIYALVTNERVSLFEGGEGPKISCQATHEGIVLPRENVLGNDGHTTFLQRESVAEKQWRPAHNINMYIMYLHQLYSYKLNIKWSMLTITIPAFLSVLHNGPEARPPLGDLDQRWEHCLTAVIWSFWHWCGGCITNILYRM